MDIQSKKLLMSKSAKYYTLTVSTTPASATCTLTYDGVAHSAKTATVKEGTVISYSVYHATYGTTTGSITMNGNKTLSCTGTYSTSTQTSETAWTRPNLTANGTMGGSSCAASGDCTGSYYAYKAFSSDTTNASDSWISKTTNTGSLKFFSPDAIKVSNMSIATYGGTRRAKSGTIYASNYENSGYTSVGSFSNNSSDTISVSCNTNGNFYKYYRIDITANASAGIAPGIKNVSFTATKQVQTTSYTYYWNKTVTNS